MAGNYRERTSTAGQKFRFFPYSVLSPTEKALVRPVELPPLPEAPYSILSPRQTEVLRWILRCAELSVIGKLTDKKGRDSSLVHLKTINQKFYGDQVGVVHNSLMTGLYALQHGHLHPLEFSYLSAYYGLPTILLAADVLPTHKFLQTVEKLAAGYNTREIADLEVLGLETVKARLARVATNLELPGANADMILMLSVLSGVIPLGEVNTSADYSYDSI